MHEDRNRGVSSLRTKLIDLSSLANTYFLMYEVCVRWPPGNKITLTLEVMTAMIVLVLDVLKMEAAAPSNTIWNCAAEIILKTTLVRSCPEGRGSFQTIVINRIV
jgi:hypothetical protein